MVYTFEVTTGIDETCLSCRHWWKEDFCLVTRQLAQPGDENEDSENCTR